MSKKYSIGFLIAAVLAFSLLGGAYKLSYEKSKDLLNLPKEEIDEQVVRTKGQALNEDCFYLMEVNGYVAVYLSDKETVYEYTNILVAELPYTLQNEIKNGKYIENLEELYGFLENYSS